LASWLRRRKQPLGDTKPSRGPSRGSLCSNWIPGFGAVRTIARRNASRLVQQTAARPGCRGRVGRRAAGIRHRRRMCSIGRARPRSTPRDSAATSTVRRTVVVVGRSRWLARGAPPRDGRVTSRV
jgi:hypothetical protein